MSEAPKFDMFEAGYKQAELHSGLDMIQQKIHLLIHELVELRTDLIVSQTEM